MISKNYIQNTVESSQQHSVNIESARQKCEWIDTEMVEVMRAADAHNISCISGTDGNSCGSAV